MPCSFCGNEKIYAKGFCVRCYMRNLKNGSPEYIRNFIKEDSHCIVDDCFNPVIAKGLCEKHYKMNQRKSELISSFGYSERRKHPLYETWRYQIRVKEGREERWNDFWAFVADVGEKPSIEHKAKRHDIKKPWGLSNFYWKKIIASAVDRVHYQRQWRKNNKIASKGHSLMKQFGISLDEYIKMYDVQNGKCFICNKDGTIHNDGDKGRLTTLVVDHCHKTGKIRKLLCPYCNRALGGFKEDINLLRKAIDYLMSFQKNCDSTSQVQ